MQGATLTTTSVGECILGWGQKVWLGMIATIDRCHFELCIPIPLVVDAEIMGQQWAAVTQKILFLPLKEKISTNRRLAGAVIENRRYNSKD